MMCDPFLFVVWCLSVNDAKEPTPQTNCLPVGYMQEAQNPIRPWYSLTSDFFAVKFSCCQWSLSGPHFTPATLMAVWGQDTPCAYRGSLLFR